MWIRTKNPRTETAPLYLLSAASYQWELMDPSHS